MFLFQSDVTIFCIGEFSFQGGDGFGVGVFLSKIHGLSTGKFGSLLNSLFRLFVAIGIVNLECAENKIIRRDYWIHFLHPLPFSILLRTGFSPRSLSDSPSSDPPILSSALMMLYLYQNSTR